MNEALANLVLAVLEAASAAKTGDRQRSFDVRCHVRVHRQGFAQNRGRGHGTFPAVQDGVRRWRTSRS